MNGQIWRRLLKCGLRVRMPLDSNSGPDYTGSFRGEMIGMTPREDFDPLAPQREAALFYGLFLRGHSAETLRRDIDVPKPLQDKLLKRHRNELAIQARLQRAYTFRKQVLAIFDELVTRERVRERVH